MKSRESFVQKRFSSTFLGHKDKSRCGGCQGTCISSQCRKTSYLLRFQGIKHPSRFAGRLTVKSDVCNFGVVLLELLSGGRAVEKNKPGIEQNLLEWARPYLSDKHKLYLVMDTKLEGHYAMKGAHKAATLSLHCLNSEAKHRPLMTEVLETLEQLQNVKEMANYSQLERSGQKQSGATVNPTGHSPFNHRNANHLPTGLPRAGASPLNSYQRSPRTG